MNPENQPCRRPKTYVCIAGPYGDKDPYCVIDKRINDVRKAARELAIRSVPFYAPHLNSAHFEVIAPEAPVEFWIAMGSTFVDHAWGMVLIGDWRNSTGSVAELARARELGLYVCEPLNDAWDAVAETWRADG